MGGLFALCYCIEEKPKVNGLILSGPAIKATVAPGAIKTFLLRIAKQFFPSLCIPFRFSVEYLCSDPEYKRKRSQMALCHAKISLKSGDMMIGMGKEVQGMQEISFNFPVFGFFGSMDPMIDVESMRETFDKIKTEKIVKEYPGALHEGKTAIF